MKNNILIIIPAYNEENNILKVIDDIKTKILNADILIVNDGSTDNTEEIVKNKNIPIISLPFNFGYGNALQLGFKYAVENNYDFVIQFDGDGQHNADDIIEILKKLKTGKYDIVIGSRFIESSNFKISFLKKIAINFLRILIYIFSGYKIFDPTSGLQGLSKRVFKYYSKPWNFPDDYPDADILIKMLKLGYSAVEIPAHMKNRINGKSMHSGIKPLIYLIKISLSIFVVVLNHHLGRRKKH
jgi:glycosyltransferase involved in cell wall biosynthesis